MTTSASGALLLERQVLRQRAVADDDGSGVDRVVANDALQWPRHVHDALRRLVDVVRLAQLGARLHALVERDLRPLGHHLGDPVDHAVGDAHHPAGVLDRRLRLHLAEGDDLGDVPAAVLLGDVVDHVLAAGHGEVDVDVRHALAAGVQEALEQQRVAHRVEVGDAQAVGDQRARRRAAAGANADAVLAGEPDEVPDDQEVVREAHLLDRLQLELEAVPQLWRLRSVALAQPLLGQVAQVRHGVRALGHLEPGQVHRAQPDLGRAALGDLHRALQHVFAEPAGHQLVHLVRALQIELVVREPKPVGVVHGVLRLDAEHRLVRDRVVPRQVVDVARPDHRQPAVLGQRDQVGQDPRLHVDAAVLHLDVDVVAPEDLHQPVELGARALAVPVDQRLADASGQAAGERDDAIGVLLQLGEVDARLVPVAVQVAERDQPDQVVVALGRLGQQRQVRAPLLLRARGVVVDHVHLAAEYRLDALLLGRFGELHGARHRPVVGQPDGRHVERGGALDQRPDPAGAVEDRVLTVHVEVDVGRSSRRHPGQSTVRG